MNHRQIIEFVCEEAEGLTDCSVREVGSGHGVALYFSCKNGGKSSVVVVDPLSLAVYGWSWDEAPIAAYIVDALKGGLKK